LLTVKLSTLSVQLSTLTVDVRVRSKVEMLLKMI
jgi:hypothetical protein